MTNEHTDGLPPIEDNTTPSVMSRYIHGEAVEIRDAVSNATHGIRMMNSLAPPEISLQIIGNVLYRLAHSLEKNLDVVCRQSGNEMSGPDRGKIPMIDETLEHLDIRFMDYPILLQRVALQVLNVGATMAVTVMDNESS